MTAPKTSSFFILLAVAILIGGGGVAYGFANLAVQLTALVVLAFNGKAVAKFWKTAPPAIRLLIIATVLLPAFHLIPLPVEMWATLPGRELAVDARATLGSLQWHPLSLDRARTLVALIGLIVPLAILALGWTYSMSTLVTAGWVVVALGLVNFALGVPQVLTDGSALIPYPENPMPGVLFGTFANRNSAGVFLVICLTLLLHLPSPIRGKKSQLVRWVTGILLCLAILLTQSRSAMALSLLPLVSIVWRWIVSPRLHSNPAKFGKHAIVSALIGVALVGALLIAGDGTRVQTSIDRFDAGNEAREFIWEDATYSAQKYWPAGAGMGTFDEVFQADESLENLSAKRAGRAHNDYLELLIEAGLAGALLILCWIVLIMTAGWRARNAAQPWVAWSGGMILAVLALQSLVDYPLRSQAGLAIAAFALVLLMRGGSQRSET